jgi:hypothetical protein
MTAAEVSRKEYPVSNMKIFNREGNTLYQSLLQEQWEKKKNK